MKKSKIATIVMFATLLILLILFIVFFNIGDSFKSTYDAIGVDMHTATGAALEDLKAQREVVGANYTVFAVSSYACSILALFALGIGLAVSDKFKELEEKKAEAE